MTLYFFDISYLFYLYNNLIIKHFVSMIDKEKAIWIYNKLFSIRYFEEKIKKIAKNKSVPGYLHTYIGSEGIAVGVMAALEDDDWITSTYRNHGHAIAKNVSLKEITAEIYGRKNDYYVAVGEVSKNFHDEVPNTWEPKGVGVNKFTYWVTDNLLEEWVELPLIGPDHVT